MVSQQHQNGEQLRLCRFYDVWRPRPAVVQQSIAQVLRDQGIAVDHLFPRAISAAEFLKSTNPELSHWQTADFFERSSLLTNDPLFGFHMGQRREFRALGHLAYASACRPTIGTFFVEFSRLLPLSSGALSLGFSRPGHVTLHVSDPLEIPCAQYVEFMMTLLVQAARQRIRLLPDSTGSRATSVLLPLSCDDGAQRDEREAFWGCPVTYDTDVFGFSFRTSDFQRPLRTGRSVSSAGFGSLLQSSVRGRD